MITIIFALIFKGQVNINSERYCDLVGLAIWLDIILSVIAAVVLGTLIANIFNY